MRQRGRCACAARSSRPSSRMRAAMQKPQKLAMCSAWSSGHFLEGLCVRVIAPGLCCSLSMQTSTASTQSGWTVHRAEIGWSEPLGLDPGAGLCMSSQRWWRTLPMPLPTPMQAAARPRGTLLPTSGRAPRRQCKTRMPQMCQLRLGTAVRIRSLIALHSQQPWSASIYLWTQASNPHISQCRHTRCCRSTPG